MGLDDGQLEYNLKISADTTGAEVVKAELAGVGEAGALAGAGVAEGMQVAGAETAVAGAQAETTSKSYKGWLKDMRGDLGLVRQPMRLLHQAMGVLNIAMMAGMLIWELYQGATKKSTEELEKQRETNIDLIKSMDDVVKAGGKLTEAQREQYDATKKENDLIESQNLKTYKEEEEALKNKVATTHGLINVAKEQEGIAEKKGYTDDVYLKVIKKAEEAETELTKKLKDKSAQIEILNLKLKDSSALTEKEIKEAKEQQAQEEALIKNKIKVNDEMLKSDLFADEQRLKNKKLNMNQVKAIYDEEGAKQIATLAKNADLEISILEKQYDKHIIDEKKFNSQVEVLQAQTASKQLAIEQDMASRKKAVDEDLKNSILQNEQAVTDAGAQAMAQQLAQGATMAEATKAMGAAVVSEISKQAAAKIEVYGLEAAGKAFDNAPNIYVGAAEAAGVLAWYSALAAAVGGAGGALANSMSPSGGGGGGSTTTQTASQAATSTGAPVTIVNGSSANSGPSSGGNGGGSGQLNVTIMLDSQVLLRMIQQASFNGNLQISANAVI